MPEPHAIVVSSPPHGRIQDFDLVELDGRLLLVGSPDRSHRVCTWDPAADRWTEYRLDNPHDTPGSDYTELTSLGAAVVDGRIVIGGGGDHQGFAMWDLQTGTVRLTTEPGGVGSVARADMGGRLMLVVGHDMAVQLWDPSVSEQDDEDFEADDEDDQDDEADEEEDGDDEELDRPGPYDTMIETDELSGGSRAGSAVGAGMLKDRPVVVACGVRGGVLVWDVDEEETIAEFDDRDEFDEEEAHFALADVDGRTLVVAAAGRSIVLGDPETGEWDEPLVVPGGPVSCLDARSVRGRPIAVTGADDGTVCVFDLAERRQLGRPLQGYASTVHGVRMAELDGRPVVIAAAHADAVRVWELPL